MLRLSPELVLVDPVLAERARALLPDPPDCLALRPRAPRPQPTGVPRASTTVPQPIVVPRPTVAVPQPIVVPRPPLTPRTAVSAPGSAPQAPRPLDDPPRRGDARPVAVPIPAWAPVAATPRRRLLLRHLLLASTWVVAGLFVLSPLLAFLPSPSSEVPRLVAPGSVAAVQPDRTETTPRAGVGSAQAPKAPRRAKTTARQNTPSTRRQGEKTKPTKSTQPTRSRKSTKPTKSTKPAASPSTETVITWPAAPAATVYNVIFVAGDDRIDVWSKDNRLALEATTRQSAKTEYEWFAYAGFRNGEAVRYGPLLAHGTTRVTRDAIPETKPPAGGQVR